MPKKSKNNEPMLIVKPASRMFGLDYLHISLMILVIILVVLAFALSGFRPGASLSNCPYGTAANGTACYIPAHNTSQVLPAAEQILASYAPLNTSFSLLPYYSLINRANISYSPGMKEWAVVIPYLNPYNIAQTLYFSLYLYDANLTLAQPFIQAPRPGISSQNQVVGLGAVSIFGRSFCSYKKPIPVYDIVDPYANGSIQSFYTGINATNKFGSAINLTYKIVFTGFAIKKYPGYGANLTQQLGASIWCASNQGPTLFKSYLANLSIIYSGNPIANGTLSSVAVGSGLNMTKYNSCMGRAPTVLNAQAQLAQLYGISVTPTYVVNCKYTTLPQTLSYGINYALGQINTTTH